MMGVPIRIIIVDDHEMVRQGLITFLRTSADFMMVGEGANGLEAIELCGRLQPDIVLMDLLMPEMNGFIAISTIHKRFPAIKVIAISSAIDSETVTNALRAGAASFLLKNVSNDKLAEAIRSTYRGERTFSPEATQILVDAATRPLEPHYQLTEREMEVLRLMSEGNTNEEIARQISLSRSTVKYYVSAVISKLGVSNRAEAIAVAFKHRIM